jgi:hypothetical protein
MALKFIIGSALYRIELIHELFSQDLTLELVLSDKE